MSFRYNGRCGEGFQRKRREQRRIQAELRAEDTTHERTKAHRLNKCGCDLIETLPAVA